MKPAGATLRTGKHHSAPANNSGLSLDHTIDRPRLTEALQRVVA